MGFIILAIGKSQASYNFCFPIWYVTRVLWLLHFEHTRNYNLCYDPLIVRDQCKKSRPLLSEDASRNQLSLRGAYTQLNCVIYLQTAGELAHPGDPIRLQKAMSTLPTASVFKFTGFESNKLA